MFERIAIYAGLRSTYQELGKYKTGMPLIHTSLNFQRGLIVLKDLDGDFDMAFSSFGYFLVGDGNVGSIHFEREREWKEREAMKRLRRGNLVDARVSLDGHVNVELDEPRNVNAGGLFSRIEIDRLKVEQYLMEKHEAFPRLKKRYAKALAEEIAIYAEAYPVGDAE
ncbi:MAG: hypothetical protein KKG75_00655 [Nanoarchaeota archaeon]|nr:hypothetical protein [Nanoarchaeota archaeon]